MHITLPDKTRIKLDKPIVMGILNVTPDSFYDGGRFDIEKNAYAQAKKMEKEKIGGWIRNANLIENYPGYYKGIKGMDLVNRFERHLAKTGIKIKKSEATGISYKNNRFLVKTKNQNIFADYVVVASGAVPKELKVKGIERIDKDKILYKVEDILKINNKTVVVVGSGDAAFDYALSLDGIENKKNRIILVGKLDKPKCLPSLEKKVLKSDVKYRKIKKIVEITRFNKGIMLYYESKGIITSFYADYILVAIGKKDNTHYLIKGVRNKNNLFMIGDAAHNEMRQIGIAVGDGIRAAISIKERINNES